MFKNMKVGTKLITGFVALSILGAIVAAIGIFNMSRIDDKADEMYRKELLGLSYIKEANVNLVYIGRARGNVLLSTTVEEREKNTDNIKNYLKAVKENIDKAKPLFVSDRAKELFTQYENVKQEYEKALWNGLSVAAEEKLQERSEALSQALSVTRQHANTLDKVLTELSTQKEARAEKAAEEATELYEAGRLFMILLVVVSVLIGLAMGVLITRSLTRQLGGEPAYAVEVANRIAAGDLASSIVTRPKDQSSLLFAMYMMRENLVKIVSQVRTGTNRYGYDRHGFESDRCRKFRFVFTH